MSVISQQGVGQRRRDFLRSALVAAGASPVLPLALEAGQQPPAGEAERARPAVGPIKILPNRARKLVEQLQNDLNANP